MPRGTSLDASWAGRFLHPRRFPLLIQLSLLLRAALIMYGSWQDEHFQVKYSDVDYAVVSDGAALLLQSESPYNRTTYRYSPLLALALVPNHLLHAVWGKFVFVGFDLLSGWLLYVLAMHKTRGNARQAMAASLSWLWNPVVIGISTRGSSDAIVCAMVLGMSLLLQTGRLLPAAALHGLAVHWRIYPVIFAPTMLVFLQTWQDRALLSLCSFGTFALLGAACWGLYREQFLNETFLYHITRTDIRHNFSAWFLALYLRMNQPANSFVGLATFAPQLATQAAIVAKFARKDFDFCIALQTMAFVAFNKVVTAQYFVWYMALLPTALLAADVSWRELAVAGAAWAVCELHWLAWAYRVEFLGESAFEGVFVAGLLFFAVNVALIGGLMRRWKAELLQVGPAPQGRAEGRTTRGKKQR